MVGVYRVPVKGYYQIHRVDKNKSWDDVYGKYRCGRCNQPFNEGDAYVMENNLPVHIDCPKCPFLNAVGGCTIQEDCSHRSEEDRVPLGCNIPVKPKKRIRIRLQATPAAPTVQEDTDGGCDEFQF